MPIQRSIVHLIDKQPDGQPAVLHARDSELAASQAMEDLLTRLNDTYNAKPKVWGFSIPTASPTRSAHGWGATWTTAISSPSAARRRST